MSLLKANAVQLGQSVTATNNFTWYQPASPDGTVRLGNGNSGSVTDLVTLTSAGNLGLGVTPSAWTSSGAATLQIKNSGFSGIGNDTHVASNAYYDGANWRYIAASVVASNYYQSAGTHVWRTTGVTTGTVGSTIAWSTPMTLNASGNLLLGTASNYRLSVGSGAVGVVASFSDSIAQTLQISTGSGYVSFLNSNNGAITWRNYSDTSEYMRLENNGNLLVGTTSTTITNGGMYISPGSGTLLDIGHASGSASGNFYELFRYAGTVIGSITQNGTTGVLYNITSDQRLKENIVDAPNALDSVNAIKVRSFDWKSDGSHVDYGYIAQELLEVAPEAVHVPADPEEMMGVDFGKLTPRLVKAIQELSAELNELKQRIK